jgi:pimeloyl-ACP methyl ester carboxylesterase
MRTDEVDVPALGRVALLWSPDGDVRPRGGCVALHGAALPQRRQPIFEHLATVLTQLGISVLTYDRRSWPAGDTPLQVQADDARHAVRFLRAELGREVGIFGFSQGAWAASLAAADFPDVSFLALVGCSGVSPARQMRYYTDELLRRAGYSAEDRALLGEARAAMEEVLRGAGDRRHAERLLAAAVDRPWFELSYLPRTLPGPGDSWPDMDYDPEPAFSRVRCPVLLVYGDDEECVPAEASKSVWRRAAGSSTGSRLMVVDLPGCGHFPAPGRSGSSTAVPVSAFSAAYTTALERWAGDVLRSS